jgi:broad specificity phosphatase PhoE
MSDITESPTMGRTVGSSGESVHRGATTRRQAEGSPPEPADVTRIYLVRHGRTALNAAGVIRGHLDPALDSVGHRQASALGDTLFPHKLQLVIASPLKRAVETAWGIASRADLDVETDSRLIDRDYGSWAGRARDDVIARYGSLDAAPGVEAQSEVLARAMGALGDARRRVEGGAAVVVSHDAVNSVLLRALDRRLEDVTTVPQDTGCFNVIEYRDHTWNVLSVNNAAAGRVSSFTSDQWLSVQTPIGPDGSEDRAPR